MEFAAYSFHDYWWTSLEDIDVSIFENDDWLTVGSPVIRSKVRDGLDINMQLQDVTPHLRRVLLRCVERNDNYILYVSEKHGAGVVFRLAEQQLPPDVVLAVHADDGPGHLVLTGCSMAGTPLVEYVHAKSAQLTVKDLLEAFRNKLRLSRTTRLLLMATRSGKLVSAVHGRLYFPRFTKHTLKPTRRLRAKTFFGDRILKGFFVPTC